MDKKNSSLVPKVIAAIIIGIFILLVSLHIANQWDLLSDNTSLSHTDKVMKALLAALEAIQSTPFKLYLTESVKIAALYSLSITFILYVIIFSDKKNTLFNREFGSARWANTKEEKAFADKNPDKNILLTSEVSLSVDTRKVRRNLNIMVLGGTGAGKTRFFVKPNLLQAILNGTSVICTDPKGENLRSCGKPLEDAGYEVLVFNLIEKEYSCCYNPFVYIHCESDILKLTNQLVKSTNPQEGNKGGASSDPFWEQATATWLQAIISYLWMECKKEEQNIDSVMMLLSLSSASEEDENARSKVDMIFEKLEAEKGSDYFPVKQYKIYKQAAGKTAKSILISIGSRLSSFNIAEVRNLMITDTIGLDKIGNKKTALFIVIPDSDPSLNFIVALLYSQLFNELYFQADFGEVKWNDGVAFYHSRYSLMEKRKKIEDTYKKYLMALGEKKKDRLFKECYQLMDNIQEEFGVPPLKTRVLNESNFERYLDAIDNASCRLNNRKQQLGIYYRSLVHHFKALDKLKSEKKKLNGDAEKIKQKEISTLQNKADIIEKRLYYEYGITRKNNNKKNTQSDIQFLDSIKLFLNELSKNELAYGSEVSFHERVNQLEELDRKRSLYTYSLEHDFKRNEQERKKCVEMEIREIDEKIKVLELISYYEFGIKDMKKRMNSGRLPVPVQCILDEFANIAPIQDFQKLIATMRSRGISVCIVLQAIAQLKEKYGEFYESITGNCDSFLFLGGQEQQTLDYIVKKLGKVTIDKRSSGTSRGSHPSNSQNWDKLGRELLMANEIGQLKDDDNNRQCLLFIRGMHPYLGTKIDITKHKKYNEMGDSDNYNDPKVIKYKEKFITKEAGMKAQVNKDNEENARVISRKISRSIANKISYDKRGCFVTNKKVMDELINNGHYNLTNDGTRKAEQLTKIIESNMNNKIPYGITLSASQILNNSVQYEKEIMNTKEIQTDDIFSALPDVNGNKKDLTSTKNEIENIFNIIEEQTVHAEENKYGTKQETIPKNLNSSQMDVHGEHPIKNISYQNGLKQVAGTEKFNQDYLHAGYEDFDED